MRRFFLVSLSAVLLLELLRTVVFAVGAPDITVRVAYDDAQEQNTGVPGAVVVITADNGSFVQSAKTDDAGTAILKKLRIKPGRQIRIGIQGIAPDGIKIYQKGSDKTGMLVDYLPGLQQNFIVARDGQAWPDHKQWDQGLTDEAEPGAYAERGGHGNNQTLPDSAPYMGKNTKTLHKATLSDNTTTATSIMAKQRASAAPANRQAIQTSVPAPAGVPSAGAPPLSSITTVSTTLQQPSATTILPAAHSPQSVPDDGAWLYGLLIVCGVLAAAGIMHKKTRR